MEIYKLTLLGFHLNGAAGSGKYEHIRSDDIKKHIRNGTLFQFLKTDITQSSALSQFATGEINELADEWSGFENAVEEHGKFCIRNDSGLHLLVAYILESIQERAEKSKTR